MDIFGAIVYICLWICICFLWHKIKKLMVLTDWQDGEIKRLGEGMYTIIRTLHESARREEEARTIDPRQVYTPEEAREEDQLDQRRMRDPVEEDEPPLPTTVLQPTSAGRHIRERARIRRESRSGEVIAEFTTGGNDAQEPPPMTEAEVVNNAVEWIANNRVNLNLGNASEEVIKAVHEKMIEVLGIPNKEKKSEISEKKESITVKNIKRRRRSIKHKESKND